jgi:cobalt-precorrin 5A hydrolase
MTTLSIVLGIGCRRGVSVEEIEAAVQSALNALDTPGARSLARVRVVASIEGKSDEAALLAFCERHHLTLQLFTAQQIEGVDTHAPASAQVRKHLGVGGVCEPCALLASPQITQFIIQRATHENRYRIAPAHDAASQGRP